MINYELAKKLKKAGFPKSAPRYADEIGPGIYIDTNQESIYYPTLSELIAACGNDFRDLLNIRDELGAKWAAQSMPDEQGRTITKVELSPEEAVVNLWLALNTK